MNRIVAGLKSSLAIACVTVAFVACKANAEQQAPPPVSVETTRVTRQTIATYENLDGQVVPFLQSSLSTQQSGTIVRVYANEGDRVRAGETLAKIDDSPLQAQLEQQRGSALQAQAKLGQSRTQLPITSQQYASALQQAEQSLVQARQQQQTDRAALANARLVFQSNEQLLGQGYVAQTSYQQAQASYVAAQQTLRIDTEKIAQAQAALAQARRNLLNTPLQQQVIAENRGAVTSASGQLQLTQTQIGQTTLAAPFDGVVTQRFLDPGAYAGPNAPLFQISQIDPTYVTFNAKDADLDYLRLGTAVTFTTSAHPGRRYDAHVVDVNAVPTSGTLLYRSRLVVRNPDESLRGGMLVTVRLTKAVHPDVLVVPRQAVLQNGDKSNVFLVAPAPNEPASPEPNPQPSGSPAPRLQAVRAAVTVGLQTDTYVEIASPKIHAGTEVIASRPDTVQDKTPIRDMTR